MLVELLIIVVLTLANGVFSGAELAILSVRKTRLRELVEGGSRRARSVQGLRDHAERFLATVQIGITVISATAAAFGGSSLALRLEVPLRALGLGASAPQVSLAIVIAAVSFLSIVLGELVPKSLGLRYAEGYALAIAPPMTGIAWLARPLVWLLTASSNVVLRLFGDRTSFSESRLSSDELQQLVEEAARTGSVHPRTGEIASRAFDLADLTAADVMIPRPRVVMLPRHAPAAEVQRVLLEEGHSRMPVYEGTRDHIVGYVVAKDLLGMAFESGLVILEDALRPAYFVPETTRALDVLQNMQRRRILLAVVVDEVGGLAGIITMEDLVEELVGEIFSERDVPPEPYRREPDGSVVVAGTEPIRELNRALEVELPEEEGATTLGGLCEVLAGEIPEAGARLTAPDGTTLEVLEATPQKVTRVRLRPRPAPPPPADR